MLANLLDKYCFKTKEQIAVQNKTVKFTKKSIRQLCLLPIILLSVVFLFLKMQNIHSHITFFFLYQGTSTLFTMVASLKSHLLNGHH